MRYALTVDTYEGQDLVVRHVFYGQTAKEAREVYAAHLTTDSFLSSCLRDRRFSDIKCRTVVASLSRVSR